MTVLDLKDVSDVTTRLDDWASTTSGLGGVRDKHRGIGYARRARLARSVIDALYEQEPLVARAVDLVVTDSFRTPWSVTDLTGSNVPSSAEVRKMADTIDLDKGCMRAGKWSRQYGGALLVMPVYDRLPPDVALQARRGTDMFPLKVVDSHNARPNWTDADFSSPTYLQTLDYDVTGLASDVVRVHHSRVVPFEAIELPPEALQQQNLDGWGPSIIERMYGALTQDGAAASHAISMMYISSVLHIGLGGFWDKYGTTGGPEQLQRWMTGVRRNLDSLGILALDAEDKVGNLSLAVTGADRLLEQMRERLGSAVDMPPEIFFNKQGSGGLGDGSLSGPQALWNKRVQSYRADVFTPAIRRVLEVLFVVRGYQVDDFTIEWADLAEPSDQETAARAAENAASDAIYLDRGVVSPDQVADHRFVKGDQGALSIDAAPEAEPLDLEVEAGAPAPVAASGEVVADLALNGAQIASMIAIVEKVQAGLLPRDSAVALIAAAFPAQAHMAETIMGSAGAALATAPAPGSVVATATEAAPSAEPPPEDLMSPRDAAAKFSLPTRTITKAIERGDLPYWGLGAHKRVSLAAVFALAKSHEPAPESESEPEAEPEAEPAAPVSIIKAPVA